MRRCVLLLFLISCAVGRAQTLAHPGWRGNGIAPEAWWKHTAIIRFDAGVTFKGVEEELNLLSEVGADSILLPDLKPAAEAAEPFDPRFGSEEDLDALLREASARRMHVLLRVPLLRVAANSGEVRFWMTRGIGGFDVGEVRLPEMDSLHLLRTSLDHYPGQRLLIARVSDAETASHPGLRPQLREGPTLPLISLEEARSHGVTAPLAVDVGDLSGEAATGHLPGNAVPIVNASLLGGESGREQVRKIIARRSMGASRNGSVASQARELRTRRRPRQR